MTNWSSMGILVGAIFSLGSFIRYYIIYQDLSEVVIGVSIGLLICSVSWLYSKYKDLEFKLLAVEDYLADNGEANA